MKPNTWYARNRTRILEYQKRYNKEHYEEILLYQRMRYNAMRKTILKLEDMPRPRKEIEPAPAPEPKTIPEFKVPGLIEVSEPTPTVPKPKRKHKIDVLEKPKKDNRHAYSFSRSHGEYTITFD